MTSTVPGDIDIAGSFVAGSESIGILIIAYSLTNDSFTKYSFIPRFVNEQKRVTVMDLSIDEYYVSVFVVQQNGLPFNRSATRPRNVHIVRKEAGKYYSYYVT